MEIEFAEKFYTKVFTDES